MEPKVMLRKISASSVRLSDVEERGGWRNWGVSRIYGGESSRSRTRGRTNVTELGVLASESPGSPH